MIFKMKSVTTVFLFVLIIVAPTMGKDPVNNDVLLVHENRGDLVIYYDAAFQANGLTYTNWDVHQQDLPSVADMQQHEMVLWFCEQDFYLSTGADDILMEYLDNWGKLFITGSRVYAHLHPYLIENYLFYNLQTPPYTDQVGVVIGLDGNIFESLVPFGIAGGDGADNNGLQVSLFDPIEGFSSGAFDYDILPGPAGLFAGMTVDAPKHRAIFLGFTFESINAAPSRFDVMNAAHGFLTANFRPLTTITSGPEGNVPQQDVAFTWEGEDDQTTNLLYKYKLIIDGEGEWSVLTPDTQMEFFGLENNTNYRFVVKAYDGSVYDSTPADRTFEFGDGLDPDTFITHGPSGPVTYNDAGFLWDGTDNQTDPYMLRFSFRLLGNDPQCHDWTPFEQNCHPATYQDLADGEYTFEVRAMDLVGHIDETPASRTWTIDYEPSPGSKPKEPVSQMPD